MNAKTVDVSGMKVCQVESVVNALLGLGMASQAHRLKTLNMLSTVVDDSKPRWQDSTPIMASETIAGTTYQYRLGWTVRHNDGYIRMIAVDVPAGDADGE